MRKEGDTLPRRILRQPLVHFLVLGAALVALYALLRGGNAGQERKIVVSAQQIELFSSLWGRRWRRPPTPEELEGLIQGYIREEVLYREALAMGLDRDDTIVRRRLAQKIEFLSQDLAAQSEPSSEELRVFYEEHPEMFREPAKLSFSHVYVNADQHAERAAGEAQRLLDELRLGADPRSLGDRFMLQRHYLRKSPQEVARHFGSQFAAELFELPVGDWRGPVQSGYGLHLVLVEDRQESYLPALDEIRSDVRDEFISNRRRELDEAVYARLREGYEIVVERPPAAASDVRQSPAARR